MGQLLENSIRLFLVVILFVITLPGLSPPAMARSSRECILYDLAFVGVNPDTRGFVSLEERQIKDSSMEVDEEALDLLIRIIYAEAEGEPYMGMVAVGAVVLNRVKSSLFPDSIHGVVYDRDQFEPLRDGRIHLEANSSAKRAAIAALRGEDPTGGALYFYNRETVKRRGRYDLIQWFDTNTTLVQVIGNHTFTK